jgi:hypothetical protein
MENKTQTDLLFDRRAFNVALASAGLNITRLGELIPISRTRMTAFVTGSIPRPEVRARIAELLRVDETNIWLPVAMTKAVRHG